MSDQQIKDAVHAALEGERAPRLDGVELERGARRVRRTRRLAGAGAAAALIAAVAVPMSQAWDVAGQMSPAGTSSTDRDGTEPSLPVGEPLNLADGPVVVPNLETGAMEVHTQGGVHLAAQGWGTWHFAPVKGATLVLDCQGQSDQGPCSVTRIGDDGRKSRLPTQGTKIHALRGADQYLETSVDTRNAPDQVTYRLRAAADGKVMAQGSWRCSADSEHTWTTAGYVCADPQDQEYRVHQVGSTTGKPVGGSIEGPTFIAPEAGLLFAPQTTQGGTIEVTPGQDTRPLIEVRDLRTGRTVRTLRLDQRQTGPEPSSVSTDGKYLVAGDEIYDTSTGRRRWTMPTTTVRGAEVRDDRLFVPVVSPEGHVPGTQVLGVGCPLDGDECHWVPAGK